VKRRRAAEHRQVRRELVVQDRAPMEETLLGIDTRAWSASGAIVALWNRTTHLPMKRSKKLDRTTRRDHAHEAFGTRSHIIETAMLHMAARGPVADVIAAVIRHEVSACADAASLLASEHERGSADDRTELRDDDCRGGLR
jgi:hypothetical protein